MLGDVQAHLGLVDGGRLAAVQLVRVPQGHHHGPQLGLDSAALVHGDVGLRSFHFIAMMVMIIIIRAANDYVIAAAAAAAAMMARVDNRTQAKDLDESTVDEC